jgi:hypothetical protein
MAGQGCQVHEVRFTLGSASSLSIVLFPIVIATERLVVKYRLSRPRFILIPKGFAEIRAICVWSKRAGAERAKSGSLRATLTGFRGNYWNPPQSGGTAAGPLEQTEFAMPRYYLDLVEDGVCLADHDGMMADELVEAEVEASFTVAEMMTDPIRYQSRRDLEIVIRDAVRTTVSRVSVSVRREKLN